MPLVGFAAAATLLKRFSLRFRYPICFRRRRRRCCCRRCHRRCRRCRRCSRGRHHRRRHHHRRRRPPPFGLGNSEDSHFSLLPPASSRDHENLIEYQENLFTARPVESERKRNGSN